MSDQDKKEGKSQSDPSDLRLLKPADAAQLLGICKKTVHKLVRENKLACVQITARERRFTEDQIRDFIISKTIERPIDRRGRGHVESRPLKGGEKSLRDSDKADLWKEIRSWQ